MINLDIFKDFQQPNDSFLYEVAKKYGRTFKEICSDYRLYLENSRKNNYCKKLTFEEFINKNNK